jgi:AcrR family transcriptional regulator
MATKTRMSAEERREQVLDAAMALVAQRGFDATPTLAIAEAAGISHAYLFRLFGSKEDLAVALVGRCNALVHARFEHAATAARARGEDPGMAMGTAYSELLLDRDVVLVQLHAYAASPTHPEIRAAMRESFRDLVAVVQDPGGLPEDEVRPFFATGMLMNVAVALDLPAVDAPFARTLTTKDGEDLLPGTPCAPSAPGSDAA